MIDWNELFTYKDGKLFNKVKRPYCGDIGDERGDRKGSRCCITVDNVKHAKHKIVWEMHNGPVPKGFEIDHINRDDSDNRIENLRLATHFQNLQNTKGLGYHKRPSGNYTAYVTYDGKRKYLGTYPNPYEAHGAYLEAKKELCGEYAPQ